MTVTFTKPHIRHRYISKTNKNKLHIHTYSVHTDMALQITYRHLNLTCHFKDL